MASFSTTTEPSSRAAAQADVTNVIAESSLLDGTGQIIDFPASPPSLGDVLSLPPQELSRFSLDFLNLLCASGLPDTADLNIDACLKTLAGWTEHVRQETERNLGRFHRDPEPYRHSEAYYRVLMMVTVLQQDCGVRYDPDCIKSPLFLNSGEGFLHGLLAGQANGTCANLPVLYAAIGRRLGYPIYLCLARRHVFCRWTTKDMRERFNIEGSGVGLSTPEDDYYLTWPQAISPREVQLGHFLRNLDPQEELAMFMATRGHCLLDRGHLSEAIVAYAHAHRLAPADPHYFSFLLGAINQEMQERHEGKIPSSYREAEVFRRPGTPKLVQYVLNDRFPRIDKQQIDPTIRGQTASKD